MFFLYIDYIPLIHFRKVKKVNFLLGNTFIPFGIDIYNYYVQNPKHLLMLNPSLYFPNAINGKRGKVKFMNEKLIERAKDLMFVGDINVLKQLKEQFDNSNIVFIKESADGLS